MIKNVILLKNKTTPKDPYDVLFLQKNYNPIFIPLLKHSHFDKKKTLNYLTSEEFLNIPIFIITSQRAVEIFNECLQEIEDRRIKDIIFSKVGYTVGPATFKILQESGFNDVRGGNKAGNGSILSDIIMEEVSKDQEIVFFTGEIRKDIIPRKLKANSFKLTERIIYKTESRNDIAVNFGEALNYVERVHDADNWIVFFSPQGTEPIVDFIRNSKAKFQIASIGPTTEEYLIQNSIRTTVTSKSPHAEALFQGINEAFNSI